MKKLLTTLALAAVISGSAVARGNISRDPDTLPPAARTTIDNKFKAKISIIKIDKTLSHINEYEVILTDGTEVTFDAQGNWKEIEAARGSEVPKEFVPQATRDYVKSNHKGAKIVSIERKRGGKYDIELSNGIDIIANPDGTFNKYD